jgi:transcription factor IIIB 90 kDa subunit
MPVTAAQVIKPRAGVTRKRRFSRVSGELVPPGGLPVFRASTPGGRSNPGRSQTPVQHRRRCANPTCTRPDVRQNQEDGSYVCYSCGTVAEQDSGLIAEQQFNEQPGGRITAQGQTIGQDQTHARAQGQPTGGGQQEVNQTWRQSEAAAKKEMQNLCAVMNLPEAEIEPALKLWKMAYKQVIPNQGVKRFVQGRSIANVATVCLYMALRRKREQVRGVLRPKYPVMLIDFAEHRNVDVFSLGKMYTDLVRTLYFSKNNASTLGFNGNTIDLFAHGPEVLVDRFVESLEFPPNAVRKVKDDAIRIVSRMKRDWINVGRRPAGVCGAAVLLAARMNNFRRTTREVVLTAKVNEITLNKRLEEFSDLRSSKLSVEEFRNNEILNEIPPAAPPAFMRARYGPKPKKRKKRQGAGDTAAEIEDDEEDEGTDEDGEHTLKRARVDAEGFAIPAIPNRPQTDNDTTTNQPSTSARRGSGRPKGAKNWRPPPITAAEEAIEQEIERDIDLTLSENPDLIPPGLPPTLDLTAIRTHYPILAAEVDATRQAASQHGNTQDASLDLPLGENEFDDDPDVATCVLNEQERRIKEMIWVNANKEYLRTEHAKLIKKQLRDAELTRRGIDPKQRERDAKGKLLRKDGRRGRTQIGDTSYLKNPPARERGDSEAVEDGSPLPDREGSVASDASGRYRSPSADAFPSHRGGASAAIVSMMRQRKAAFETSRINWQAIEATYGGSMAGSSSPTSSGTDRRSGSKRMKSAEVIFGAMGGKGTGLVRSKSSLSAERRELNKKRKEREASGVSDAAGPSGAREESVSSEGSGSAASASASPTPTPGPASAPATITQPASHAQTQSPIDDGSVEELVGTHTTSSHSTTPTAALGQPEDDDESDGEDIYGLRGSDDDDDDYGEDDDDDENGPAVEPDDFDAVFAGHGSGRH